MGDATLESKDHTDVTECMAICLSDESCLAFYHHNLDDHPDNHGKCFYYNSNNVTDTVGQNVELSTFFDTSQVIVGPELLSSTDVYVKNGQKYRELTGGTIQVNT